MVETSNILETRGISHTFGVKTVCQNIDIKVPNGSFFGFLGENGSGKTTIIRIILQHLIPNAGEVLFQGKSFTPSDMLHIGSLVETPSFFPLLSIEENLLVMGRFRNVYKKEIESILDDVGLLDYRDKKVQTLSLGMKQRLAIARSFLGNPRLLILDEPTNGLDPTWRKQIRDMLLERNRKGTTIFMSSHILNEIEQCCSHVCVLHDTNIQFQGTIAELKQAPQSYELKSEDMSHLKLSLRELGYKVETEYSNMIQVDLSNDSITSFHASLISKGVTLTHLRKIEHSLEDRFVGLTKGDSNHE
jgi:ABC-2 type transport system ATP-binding protein